MQVTATEAKNKFGDYCAQAKTEEVIVEKDGRVDSVILSCENFRALKDSQERKTQAQRRREFNETYKDWLAAQHQDFEKNGLWCDGVVAQWRGEAQPDGSKVA